MKLKQILLSTVAVLFIADMAIAASDHGRPRTQSEEDLQTAMALSLSEQDQRSGGAARSGTPRGRASSPRRVAPSSAVRTLGGPVMLNAESRAVLCDAIRTQLSAHMKDAEVTQEVAVVLNGTAYKVRVVFGSFDRGDGMGLLPLSGALPLICQKFSSIDKQLSHGNEAHVNIARDWRGNVIELNMHSNALLSLTFTKQ